MNLHGGSASVDELEAPDGEERQGCSYDDFYIDEADRPNSQSKKKNDKYQEYIMTNYDTSVFAPQRTFFGEYGSGEKSCKLVHWYTYPKPL